MAASNVLTYSASITLPSGQVYTFSGMQTLGTTSVAALQAAVRAAVLATAMAAVSTDVVAKVTVGMPAIPSLLARQTAAHK